MGSLLEISVTRGAPHHRDPIKPMRHLQGVGLNSSRYLDESVIFNLQSLNCRRFGKGVGRPHRNFRPLLENRFLKRMRIQVRTPYLKFGTSDL